MARPFKVGRLKSINNSSCKNVSFFKIPKNCAWLDLLRLGDSRVYPRSCICSNHFKEGDMSHGKRASLKKNATPLLSRPAH